MGFLLSRSAADGEESAALLGTSICKAECGLYSMQPDIRNLLFQVSETCGVHTQVLSTAWSLTPMRQGVKTNPSY